MTHMGVTSEHPPFTVGEGWTDAGELVVGDVIRDSALQELTVLTVALDTTPQRVHNLEVAGAHTYFAGELEAWGHNKYWWKKGGGGRKQLYDTKTGRYVCKKDVKTEFQMAAGDFASGVQNGWSEGVPDVGGSLSNKCGYGVGWVAKQFIRYKGG